MGERKLHVTAEQRRSIKRCFVNTDPSDVNVFDHVVFWAEGRSMKLSFKMGSPMYLTVSMGANWHHTFMLLAPKPVGVKYVARVPAINLNDPIITDIMPQDTTLSLYYTYDGTNITITHVTMKKSRFKTIFCQ